MVLIVDNIITPYEIDRYNRINRKLHGDLHVWFHRPREVNRNWTRYPDIRFSYHISRIALQFDLIRFFVTNRRNISRVICCGWNDLAYWLILLYSKCYSIRFTLWSGSTTYERSIKRSLSWPLVRIFVSLCDDFIAYGSRAKTYVQTLGASPSNIKILYNSVDVEYFHKKSVFLRKQWQKLRIKYSIPAHDTVILFVGQLIERKGIRELLETFNSLHRKKTTLFIVGSGPLKNSISGKSIIQIDHLEYDMLPEAYAVSDVLILPSKEEVWGLVVNEAMASGLPVLVSKRAGCAPDLVDNGKNGFIFEPNKREISLVLYRYLLLHQNRQKSMGEAGYKKIKSLYDQSIY